MAEDSKSQINMKGAIESILSCGVDEIEKYVNNLYEETRYSIEYINTGFEKDIKDYIKKRDALEEEIAEYEDELNDIYAESSDPTEVKVIVEGGDNVGLIELVETFDENNERIEEIVEEQSEYEEGSEKWEFEEEARKALVLENEEITEMIDSIKAELRELGVTNDMYDEILTIWEAQYIKTQEYNDYKRTIEIFDEIKQNRIKTVSENPIVINILRYMARLLKANITFVSGYNLDIDNVTSQKAQPE